jgi:hypothetical protein
MTMSEALQVLLDSGAIYLALGAVLCIVLGVGAVRRLFRGASKLKHPDRMKDR